MNEIYHKFLCSILNSQQIHNNDKWYDISDYKYVQDENSISLCTPGFISYFLSFMHESTINLKCPQYSDDSPSCWTASHSNKFAFNDRIKQKPNYGSKEQKPPVVESCNLMSTPKLRDDFASPKNIYNSSNSSIFNDSRSSAIENSMVNDSLKESDFSKRYGNRTQSHKQSKHTSLILKDFLCQESSTSRPQRKKFAKNKRHKPSKSVDNSLTGNSTSGSPHFSGGRGFTHIQASGIDRKSPVNPLMSQASRSISFDLEDEGEFPDLSLRSPPIVQVSKPTRRIKPTAVSVNQNLKHNNYNVDHHSSVSGNVHCDQRDSNPFLSAIAVSCKNDLCGQREWLMSKCLDKDKLNKKQVTPLKVPEKSIDDISPVKQSDDEPDPMSMFETPRLKRLAGIYSYYINSFLVPCVITELQFVVGLILTPYSNGTNESLNNVTLQSNISLNLHSLAECEDQSFVDPSKLLSSVENTIYFATLTLESLITSGIASILGRGTLSLLLQNNRIQRFMPCIKVDIMNLIENLDLKEKDVSSESKHECKDQLHRLSGVPFEADTDDRSNFSSDRSFHAFRKQRDMFYSLIREYEEKKTNSNFKIQNNLGSKILNLIKEIRNFGTYQPFTRLFVSQMLLVSVGEQIVNPHNDASILQEEHEDLKLNQSDSISSLMQVDPEKFRRLQTRFVTAANPMLKGQKVRDYLEDKCYFFKEFVACADSYTMNIHLFNELKERIYKLETQQSQQILDDVLAESVNSSGVSSSLTKLITSLQILGKFLGFLAFEPYNIDRSLMDTKDECMLQYISKSLEDASQNGHELLTVPWCTEYLKEANFSFPAGKITHIAGVFFSIFRKHVYDRTSQLTSGNLLIILAIAKSFSFSIFRAESFYALVETSGISKFLPKIVSISLPNRDAHSDPFSTSHSFDRLCLPIISFTMIYECHETLKEIRSAILSWNVGTQANGSKPNLPQRKIKPSTEIISEESASEKKEKKIQSDLEDHFFRGQPSSLQRTVSFVAERCASNCVKHIRSVAMLDFCDQAEQKFRKRFKGFSPAQTKPLDKVKLIKDIVMEMKELAHKEMSSKASAFCVESVQQCMKHLSSCETADGVITISAKIARDKALASVRAWLSTRLDELVTMSVKARLAKVTLNVNLMPKEKPDANFLHDEQICSVSPIKIQSLSSLFHMMKEHIVKLTFEDDACIYPNFFGAPSEQDVTYLIQISSMLLCDVPEEGKHSFLNCDKDDIRSMRKLLHLSPHLRTSLFQTAKELSYRRSLIT